MMNWIFVFSLLVQRIAAHSWVECSSYDPVSFDYRTLGNYDRARCSGYPRGFKRQFDAGFGVDTGYNSQLGDCSRDPYNAADYNNQVLMAKYKPGQTIYISHPAKNHVADTCTNQFIPSVSFKVMMSGQPDVDTFDVDLPMVGAEHTNGVIDHLGYQRCFNFCSNMDKAHCLSAWKLPTGIMEGRHSFQWRWELNSGEFFTNCFDAYITASDNLSTTIPIIDNSSSGLSSSSSSSSSGSSSGSNVSDTIVFPSATPASTSLTLSPEPTTPEPTTPEPTTPEPTTKTPTSTPEVVTSGAPSSAGPLAAIHSYIMNITGGFNVSGLLNITIFDELLM